MGAANGATPRAIGTRRLLPVMMLTALIILLSLGAGPSFAKSTHEYTGVSFGPDGTSASRFEHPGAVGVDQSTHNLYLADYGAGAVYKFNEKGEVAEFSALSSQQIGGFSFSTGEADVQQIAVNSVTHDFYVVDYGTKSLKAFRANGEPAEFSSLGSSQIGSFSELCGVAVDQNGDIYAGDFFTGVHVYGPSGVELTSFPAAVSCNLAVDSHGDVYVNHWKNAVEKFTPSAYPVTLATTYTSAGDVDENPAFGLTVDPASDDVYVDERASIAQYDEHGALLATFAAAGPGAVSASEGIAVDATSGDVYVSDADGERQVEIFGPLVPLIEHTLAVTNESTTGTGTVTSSPVGIDCGGSCSAPFAQNSTVTLTATPGTQSKFTGWSGPDAGSCGAAPTCEIPIGTSDRAITATFAFGTPIWSLQLEHHNAYGAQRAECPGGHESLGNEPPCGVDPYTGRGTTFSKESAFNEYRITVTNAGDAQIIGSADVSDKLPAGVVATTGSAEEQKDAGWKCTIDSSVGAVSCARLSATDVLGPGASYPPIVIHTYVKTDATSGANVVSVAGGGAATVSANDQTTVTDAVPFGFKTVTTSTADSLAAPFTAAAGHPFSAAAELVLNTVPNVVGNLGPAGGSPKSVTVDLPAGFIGNPQAAAQCSLILLKQAACPQASAVGYARVSTFGTIVHGVATPFGAPLQKLNSSLVYDLTPSPGHPAEFGFLYYQGVPLILSGNVRSDGDYGVTINAAGIPANPQLVASQVTFCENGATADGGEGTPLEYSCNPVTPQSGAFLTNPARCSRTEAPATIARAHPWDEPSDEASKTAYTGLHLVEGHPSENESFVTGCGNPELGLGWNVSSIGLTPETTQADAPTGMRFDLAIPQNNDAGKLATPELKNTTVVLPKGMSVSPSAAEGLEGCSDNQIALHSSSAGSCPNSSQVGTVEVFTPLLSSSPVAEGVPLVVEGVPSKGERLTCASGTWNDSPALSYQWLRNGVAIGGATEREYKIQKADEGKPLQCQVIATSTGGSAVAASRGVVVLEAVFNEEGEFQQYEEPATAPPLQQSRLAPPEGTASVGHELSCGSATWKGEPTFAYQWLSNGAAIPGAKAATYTLAGEDAGKAIQCQITASNVGGSVIADSEAVGVSPAVLQGPPLLGAPVQGKVFIGMPLCSPCTGQDAQEGRIFRLFIEVADPERGVIVKLPGTVAADPGTGQLTASFKDNPQLPFEDFKLAFKGGPRATLATPQACGEAKTTSDLTPWSSEPGINESQGTPDAFPSSAFSVDWDGHGGACPSSVPFAPGFVAQTASSAAGAFTPFTVAFSRGDREQDLGGISVQTPPGLLGKIAGIPQCPEAQANAGSCSPESEIGTGTVQAGAGADPFTVSGGRVYLTGPYKGQPFGLSIVVQAVAGPFNLGNVVVRASIAVNPSTGQLTVTSDPLPQIQDGVPFRLRHVTVDINRPNFIFNPTNCAAQQVVATLTGVSLNAGEAAKNSGSSSPFAAGGCAGLPFAPSFSASTQGATSKASGASLDVRVSQAGGEANIQKVDVQLPKLLPARLTTLQKACTDAQFAVNPADCPIASDVGTATAHTPVLSNPLVGPAYLVSHGGAAFPDLEVVLQGEGITLVLDGATNIKNGITYSRFETVPDAPISSFELRLPEGPHSALATNLPAKAKHSLCGQRLVMPTTITGQNGAQVRQSTKIAVTGCKAMKVKPLSRAQKLAKALKVCRKKPKRKRAVCERHARKKYGPTQAKKFRKRSSR